MEPFADPLLFRMHNIPEHFSIKDVGKGIKKGADAAGKGIKKGADTVGGGIKKGADTVGKAVLSPVGNFFKAIWAWAVWICAAVCCLCLAYLAASFGVPQMVASALRGA